VDSCCVDSPLVDDVRVVPVVVVVVLSGQLDFVGFVGVVETVVAAVESTTAASVVQSTDHSSLWRPVHQ